MAPEGQQRAMEFLAKPGQFEWARRDEEEIPDPDGAEPLQQEAAPDASGAAGNAEGSGGGPAWEAWHASRKVAGTADPRFQGLPEGCELIPLTVGYK
eukprot:10864735-Heterocapsa_arctica.AAC.2